MSQNPWGDNYHNENYSSAEMDQLLEKIFAPKCIFMGFMPAGKRKWVRIRADGAMEIIRLYSDRGFIFGAGFGLSFPWIPHEDWKSVRWHKTPKSSQIDLNYKIAEGEDWSISKSRTLADERAKFVSTQVCETCTEWFERMKDDENILNDLEKRKANPFFLMLVQDVTVYEFWQARIGRWLGLEPKVEQQFKSYFGDEGVIEIKQLLRDENSKALSNQRV